MNFLAKKLLKWMIGPVVAPSDAHRTDEDHGSDQEEGDQQAPHSPAMAAPSPRRPPLAVVGSPEKRTPVRSNSFPIPVAPSPVPPTPASPSAAMTTGTDHVAPQGPTYAQVAASPAGATDAGTGATQDDIRIHSPTYAQVAAMPPSAPPKDGQPRRRWPLMQGHADRYAHLHPADREAFKKFRGRARWLDGRRVCCGCIRIGADAILGFIPVIGDFAGAGLSLMLIKHAKRQWDLPSPLIREMYRNVALDTAASIGAIGFIPLVGDLLDIAHQANMKNAALLETHLRTAYTRGERGSAPRERDMLMVEHGQISAVNGKHGNAHTGREVLLTPASP
ncbi:hypothetical protein THASP1DRAFT_29540 [Thamnocephalis sphaerospora]|uniref:DUF4112 domain-containing protein n=1 Tax=Thamnocephalis sphaerospora TaxID=78915 RepID=A0A4P9XRF8_9FUNG|nr:hypothetical protein THASP1DRAFT_29540 [Thamnocephalis sphaerospora]|eukprot:RKP08666.1 hypothetical protein THASP1DRAFT_29540 [Thamnocephalis sphaerospora]